MNFILSFISTKRGIDSRKHSDVLAVTCLVVEDESGGAEAFLSTATRARADVPELSGRLARLLVVAVATFAFAQLAAVVVQTFVAVGRRHPTLTPTLLVHLHLEELINFN